MPCDMDRIKARNRAYYEKNKDRIKEKSRKYWHMHTRKTRHIRLAWKLLGISEKRAIIRRKYGGCDNEC